MEREDFIKRLIYIVCIVLAVCLLVAVILYQKKKARQEHHIDQMQVEAKEYEDKIRKMEKEIAQMEQEIHVKNDMPIIMIGYQINEKKDFEMIEAQANQYDFNPVIVLEPVVDHMDDTLTNFDNKKYELVITGDTSDESIFSNVNIIRECIKQSIYSITNTESFLLRKADDTEEHQKLLVDHQFRGCIRYFDEADNGVQDNGLICINYSQLRSAKFNLRERLNQMMVSKQACLFVFDLTSEEMTTEIIDKDLQLLFGKIEDKSMKLSSVKEALAMVEKNSRQEEKNQKEYQKSIEEKQELIDEYQEKIDEIYSHWDGE